MKMSDHTSPQTRKEGTGCGCLKKVSNFITGSLEKGFYRFGTSLSCVILKLIGREQHLVIQRIFHNVS